MMKQVILAIAISLLSVAAVFSQTVTVTERKVTYTRKNPIADHKRAFTITYPKVKAATPAISRKIEAALSFQNLLDINIQEEMGEYQWLEEAGFQVDHNKNGLLSVSVFMEGSGAYPSGRTVRVVIDSTTGTRITPALAFQNLSGLLSMVRQDMEKEIVKAIAEIKADKENNDFDAESQFSESAEFHKLSLNEFSVNDEGITFHHSYGFPHVARALEPDGQFMYSWSVIKPFLKPGGLLSRMAR